MSWYQQVADYIGEHLEEYIEQFFPEAKPSPSRRGVMLEPAPCCGHNGCFSFSRVKNGGYCFSCGTGGTRIQILENKVGQDEAQRLLESWSGIRYVSKGYTEEQQAEFRLRSRVGEIQNKAVEFYHQRLLSDKEALEKQLGGDQAAGQRGHTMEALKMFKVGLSGDYITFYNRMVEEKYTRDEIKEAGLTVWMPEGCFVYPYYDIKGNLIRINTKMWYRACMVIPDENGGWKQQGCGFRTFDLSKEAKEAHERETGHKMAMDGYSKGDKTISFYFAPNSLRGRRKAILIEGENDVISAWEELQKLPKEYGKDFVPIGIGGRMEDEAFREPFLRQFDALYEIFDQDDAGDGYRRELDEKIPDIPLYHVKQDPDFKDIDAFLKSAANHGQFKGMIDEAEFKDTKAFLIEREGWTHTWNLKNRQFRMQFNIDGIHNQTKQFEGNLYIFKSGQLSDKKIGRLDKINVDSSVKYALLALSQYLDEYYHDVRKVGEKPKRRFWELKDILPYTKDVSQVVKQLAWYLFNAEGPDYEAKMRQLQKLNQKVVAEVLREVNGFQNQQIDLTMTHFPRITLSQFFHVTNDDAFFYFSKVVREGDAHKLVPCLLSNKKEEIRLDLLLQKDPQSLLLIKNRYELPIEVRVAVMEPSEVSLQPHWVEEWRNDRLDPQSYEPSVVIKDIENFIRKCYFATDDIIKVLSLWVYATYFYMLFSSGFPYLIFNGPKGSGKTTFDSLVYLLSLNPKFALDITDAAMFRMINEQGGTIILDEIENLADKKSVDISSFAKILKGGYADMAYIYRMNMERGKVERFSVFGPKVISNINGIEDVIGDRCIYVRTVPAPDEVLERLEDVQHYKRERRSEVHAITSRAVISALVHFKRVNELFQSADARIRTGNARLTQIMRPLMTMATLVGGDYPDSLLNYYDKEIKVVKDEIAASTTEGMVGNLLRRISEEYLGLEKEKWATDPEQHIYKTKIRYEAATGIFEVDTMHLKVICEESNNGEEIDLKRIDNAMKNVLGATFNYKEGRKRTTATIDDFGLQRRLKENRHIRVQRYYLNVYQFVDKSRVIEPTKSETSLF